MREPLVEERVRDREDRGPVGVVLSLPVRMVADAHGTDAAVAGQRRDDPLVERRFAGDRVDRLQRTLAGVRGDRREVAHVAFQRPGRAEPVQRVDDEVSVSQPAVPVVPVALRARRLGDRRRHRGDDRAGVFVGVELQRDRGADDVRLPFVGNRKAPYPVLPPRDGLVDRATCVRGRRAGEGLVGAEHQRARVVDEERPFVGDRGERRVGRQAQRQVRRDVADVVASGRRGRALPAPVARRAKPHDDARTARDAAHVPHERRGVWMRPCS